MARFMSGVAAGLAWGILAGYARRLVSSDLQGRALAVAMVGIPVALSLGTPAGAWLGGMMGWRVPFGLMAALAVILFIWTLVAVPDLPGQQADGRRSGNGDHLMESGDSQRRSRRRRASQQCRSCIFSLGDHGVYGCRVRYRLFRERTCFQTRFQNQLHEPVIGDPRS